MQLFPHGISFSKAWSAAARYFQAAILVTAAGALAWRINAIPGQSTEPFFFAAVMLATWWGGLGPGLLATGLAGYISGEYFFLNPVGSHGFGLDDTLRLGMFLMVAVLISSLISLRKRAERQLQQVNEQLENRIDSATRDLRNSNSQLTQSEERFRLLVEGVDDYAIVMLDAAGKVVSWNAGAQRIHGYAQDEAIGLDLSTFFVPEDKLKRVPPRHLLDAAEQGRHEDEGWRVRKDGARFWANVITTALADEMGRPRGFAQVTRDITELRELEKEILDISEREQMRIGHDLHDGIGQELTGLALLAQNLSQKLALQALPESVDAGRIATLINRTLDQTRQLVRGFSPLELGPDGLQTALRDLAAKVQASSRRPCTLQCGGEIAIHDDVVAVHLYRIAQGAISNAVRHSQCTQIRISLDMNAGVVTLSISDNGIGLPPEGKRGAGIGISVMKYRARMIGGTLNISSSPKGATVTCTCSIGDSYESSPVTKASSATPGQAPGTRAAG